jgi:hypothetical protein
MMRLLSLLLLTAACNADIPSPEYNNEPLIKRQLGDLGSLLGSAFGSNLGKLKGEPGGCT